MENPDIKVLDLISLNKINAYNIIMHFHSCKTRNS